MLELPEMVCIQQQMRNTLTGKEIRNVSLLESDKLRRWGFVTQTQEELNRELRGKTIAGIENKALFIYVNTDSEYTLVLGEFDGRIRFHRDRTSFPNRVYLQVGFSDDTYLTTTVKLWGMMKVFGLDEKKQHLQETRQKAKEPTSGDFTFDYFSRFIADNEDTRKLNVKKLITSSVCVSGLGNGYLQEILFRARLHPRRKLLSLTLQEQEAFHKSIVDVVDEAIQKGGRTTERDLFDKPGLFYSRLNRETVGTECPDCGTLIERFHFEGGACYVCPSCQPLSSQANTADTG